MSAEVIEGTAVDVTPGSSGSAVVIHDQPRAMQAFDTPTQDPLRALGRMDQNEYDAEVKALVLGKQRMMQLQRDLLRQGIDYDTIPGTDRDTLLQPGAEQLAMFHRLIPEHLQTVTVTTVPGHADRIDCDTTTHLHLGSIDGPIVGTAKASCSSWEDRYRYRNNERVCPKCGKPAIYKSKAEWAPKSGGPGSAPLPGYAQGGWKCGTKKGGCGSNFPDAEPSLANASPGKVENDEPHALRNTIIQISAKRGFVGAIRHTLGITDLFTQDVEDMPPSQTAQDAPGAFEPPHPGTSTPAQAPAPRQAAPPPAAATGAKGTAATFTGPVSVVPDGMRSTANGRVLNFAIKVGNSKHNIEIWGEDAARLVPALVEGARVSVEGERFEEDYPNRGDRPKKKTIRNVTAISVENGPALEFGPVPSGALPGVTTAPSSATTDGPPAFDDEDTLPYRPEPVVITGTPGDVSAVTAAGVLRAIEWKSTPAGQTFAYLEIASSDGRGYWKVAVGQEDALETFADAAGAFTLAVGDPVQAMGGWNGKGTMLVSGMVGKLTEGQA